MKSPITLQITPQGGVAMLHDDAIDLSALGAVQISRASHVEWAAGPGRTRHEMKLPDIKAAGWFVQSAKTLIVLVSGVATREAALAWEKNHYSPGGDGWAELQEES